MNPFCQSCGAHTLPFINARPAEPHKATCPYGDESFMRVYASFLAGVDVRVAEFEAVQS